jgi:sigma-B regulation protein RsbU (phosphoserine phosphatase)
LPLGVLPEQKFNEMTLSLAPGQSLVFYTDGITEAMDAKEEMYGKVRLQEAIATSAGDIDSMVNELVESVEVFCGSSSQRDDICVTAVQCVS